MALEDLARFAQACLTTLATAYKHHNLSHQVGLDLITALCHTQ